MWEEFTNNLIKQGWVSSNYFLHSLYYAKSWEGIQWTWSYTHPLARRSKDILSSIPDKVTHKAGKVIPPKQTDLAIKRQGIDAGWSQNQSKVTPLCDNVWRRGESRGQTIIQYPRGGGEGFDEGKIRAKELEEREDKQKRFITWAKHQIMNGEKPLKLTLQVIGNLWEGRGMEGERGGGVQLRRQGRECGRREASRFGGKRKKSEAAVGRGQHLHDPQHLGFSIFSLQDIRRKSSSAQHSVRSFLWSSWWKVVMTMGK